MIAVAAATWGDTRWVRPPRPWRPSKLRLLVEADRSPGASLSGFIARHIEQPGSRQSKPASVKILSRPSALACSSTSPEPGTTSVRTPSLTERPSATAAAARRSSMRLLVQLPMNTVSISISRIAMPAFRPMYSRARSAASRSSGDSNESGAGTLESIGATWPGLVPQVMCGTHSLPSITISRSNVAPSSVASARHASTAASQSAPVGACGRPLRYSNVTSSGAMRPALAPHSIDMLQTVMRPSIDKFSMTEPRYSAMAPMPPLVPVRASTARTTSLAVAPSGSSPLIVIAIVSCGGCGSVWVASTCSTSLVPMPKASAPKAPWVLVWLSPHTTVMPGSVRPSSGPITWTMPWFLCPIG